MPSVPDPRLNTAECVISGQEKASHFSGLKNLLHGVCWSYLFISLVVSVFVSQQVLVHLKSWAEDKNDQIAAVMLLSLFILVAGISLNIYAWSVSTFQQDLYVRVFFGFVLLVFLRRCIYCIVIHCWIGTRYRDLQWDLTSGHGEDTSKNIHSWVICPAAFIACHHVLWILLGVITEPLWGCTVLVGVTSVFSVSYFLVCDLYNNFFSAQNSWFFMALILILGGFLAFALLLLVLLVVAQAFFGESLISTVVQNGLVAIGTVGYGYLKTKTGRGERGGGGGEGERRREREGEGEGKGEGGQGQERGRGGGGRRAGARSEDSDREERVELRDCLMNGNN